MKKGLKQLLLVPPNNRTVYIIKKKNTAKDTIWAQCAVTPNVILQ